jgi:hypothetical protein
MDSKLTIQQPFSNLQLELLKLYADNIPEKDLKAIQRLIARYFADQATKEADKIWDEKGYTAEKLLSGHERTPYKTTGK